MSDWIISKEVEEKCPLPPEYEKREELGKKGFLRQEKDGPVLISMCRIGIWIAGSTARREHKDRKEHKKPMDHKGLKGLKDRKEQKGLKVHMDHKRLKEHMELKENFVKPVLYYCKTW